MSNERESVSRISDDDRILAHAAPTLIPLLERRSNASLAKIHRKYFDPSISDAELRRAVGEYVTICELIREIEVKLQNLQGEK